MVSGFSSLSAILSVDVESLVDGGGWKRVVKMEGVVWSGGLRPMVFVVILGGGVFCGGGVWGIVGIFGGVRKCLDEVGRIWRGIEREEKGNKVLDPDV